MRLELPERKKQVHQMIIPIRWGTWMPWAM